MSQAKVFGPALLTFRNGLNLQCPVLFGLCVSAATYTTDSVLRVVHEVRTREDGAIGHHREICPCSATGDSFVLSESKCIAKLVKALIENGLPILNALSIVVLQLVKLRMQTR